MNFTTCGFATSDNRCASKPSACTSCGRKYPLIDCRIANPPLSTSTKAVSERRKWPSESSASRMPRSSESVCTPDYQHRMKYHAVQASEGEEKAVTGASEISAAPFQSFPAFPPPGPQTACYIVCGWEPLEPTQPKA